MTLRRINLIVIATLALLLGCSDTRVAQSHGREPQLISARLGDDAQVNLLAMGDWGNGSDRQRRVARALEQYVRDADVEFDGMLLAGDNFYVRLRGTDDPQWKTLFEDMYDDDVLDFAFYAVLGNHDYEAGKDVIELTYARENPGSRFKLPSRWYRIDFPRDDPLVTVFMLDSCRDLLRRELWHAQNAWLRDQLRAGNLGQWVIACAHHPLFSNGDHGDIGALQKTWGALLEEHGVDFYVCGHDHDLQHLQIPGWETSFILAGGGGAGVRPMRNSRRGPFSRSLHGFVHLSLRAKSAVVKFIDTRGQVVHAFERAAPDGHVRVIDTTGQDPAQPRTVKSITRPDLTTAPATAPAR